MRLARVAAILVVLVGSCVPGFAFGAEIDVVQWFSDAAAPALQAAAPTNDPMLAGRELLNRGLAGAFGQLQRVSPPWLGRVQLGLSFDPAFQPRYALAATQPLLSTTDPDGSLDLLGRVVHDAAGRTSGNVGLRYEGQFHGRPVTVGVEGGVEDRWLEDLQRYSVGAELRLRPLEVRATLFDDVPEDPVTRQIAERRLDGYDLEIAAQIPYLPWASLRASRLWQIAVDGNSTTTRDRVSLRLTPLSRLEIETGTQGQARDRSWFAQLRWRIKLGGD